MLIHDWWIQDSRNFLKSTYHNQSKILNQVNAMCGIIFTGNPDAGNRHAKVAKIVNIVAVVITAIWVTSVVIWVLVNVYGTGRVTKGLTYYYSYDRCYRRSSGYYYYGNKYYYSYSYYC